MTSIAVEAAPALTSPLRNALVALALHLGAAGAGAETLPSREAVTRDDLGAVAPALAGFAQTVLADDLWKRPGLSARDRSIVTVAALIARNHRGDLRRHLLLALDNGVKAKEVSEIVTHLAFYAGWGSALSAVPIIKEVFAERGIGASDLPPAEANLLPLDAKSEAARIERVEASIGSAAPGLARDTTQVLFQNLWLRPDLAPRDRSLVTVSALIAAGQTAQLTGHLNLGMDNGLTQAEASETISHLAYYAGWPNAFSAATVARGVFEKRPR